MSLQLQKSQWVCFQIAGETYAHSVVATREVLPYTEAVPVPGAPTEVQGIMNVRGNIVTVVSCHKLLGIDASMPTAESHIITLQGTKGLFGIVVDAVDRIIEFADDKIMPIDNPASSTLIKGTVHYEKELLIVIDFHNYLAQQETL